jgi:hypothetical protein
MENNSQPTVHTTAQRQPPFHNHLLHRGNKLQPTHKQLQGATKSQAYASAQPSVDTDKSQKLEDLYGVFRLLLF